MLPALVAGTDATVESDDIWKDLQFPHRLQQTQGVLPAATLLTSADPCIEANGVTLTSAPVRPQLTQDLLWVV